VRRAQARQPLEGGHRLDERGAARGGHVEPVRGGEPAPQRLRAVGGVDVVQALAERVRHVHRHAVGAADVLHGRRRRVGLHHAGDGGVGAAVARVHVVEELLAPVVLDVDVDVGRLGQPVGARRGEEALEEEPVRHRVDGGDAQHERDRRVGRGAAALAEDAAAAGLAHGVPHHEEEAREAEPADDVELVGELPALRRADRVAPAAARALLHAPQQEAVGRVAVGHREVRQRRPRPRQGEAAQRGHLRGGRDAGLAPAPPLGHGVGRVQRPLVVGQQQPALGGRVERGAVAQGEEHVEGAAAGGVDVAHVAGHRPARPLALGERGEGAGQRLLRAAGVVELHLDGQRVAERLPVRA
jgi:hypothetical protein